MVLYLPNSIAFDISSFNKVPTTLKLYSADLKRCCASEKIVNIHNICFQRNISKTCLPSTCCLLCFKMFISGRINLDGGKAKAKKI
jgi:hypothetical protein